MRGIIVSCQDMSTNGITVNDHRIRKSSVILMDGDTFAIPSVQTFKCVHVKKSEKLHLFDPTPSSQAPYKQRDIGKYTVLSHCLGSGTFATVHLAIDTTEHRQVACKVLKPRNKDELPNINSVFEVHEEDKMVLLCTGGDLFTYISIRTQLGEGEAKYIMYQLIEGLAYLHDRSISHREGILALDNPNLGYVGMPADCWSAGLILFIMLTSGYRDQDGARYSQCSDVDRDKATKRHILDGMDDFDPQFWSKMRNAKGLIARLLIADPDCRATAREALHHKWIAEDLVELRDAFRDCIASVDDESY
ncbi:hypothetical protein HWV62_34971 [Athelia sp. TMB]|nr:hypothetical protein HWV62_34971 [Athelia sp. TMB]